MPGDNVFAKIVRGEIPADKVYESDQVLAFRDINPCAPQHILVIPKKGLGNADSVTAEDRELLGELILTGAEVARQVGIAESGYRLVLNVGQHGGESVPHLHLHVIGGRQLGWPPG